MDRITTIPVTRVLAAIRFVPQKRLYNRDSDVLLDLHLPSRLDGSTGRFGRVTAPSFKARTRQIYKFHGRPVGVCAMNEVQTLRILGWTVGGIVGAVFVLNAVALSLI
jgi:hypothetical protein